MAHAQKPDFVFRRNGPVHLNRQRRHFSRLLAAEVCASAVAMLDTPCSEVVWRVLATHSICQFLLHFPSHASPCAITFQLDSTHFQALFGDMQEKRTRSGNPVAWMIKFWAVTPNNFGSAVWNSLYVTFFKPRILRRLVNIWKICAQLLCGFTPIVIIQLNAITAESEISKWLKPKSANILSWIYPKTFQLATHFTKINPKFNPSVSLQ